MLFISIFQFVAIKIESIIFWTLNFFDNYRDETLYLNFAEFAKYTCKDSFVSKYGD